MTDLEYWISEAMILRGGSFVKSLGKLFRMADLQNRVKIKIAFNNFFVDYLDEGLELMREDAKKEAAEGGEK
jgi:hypothetical protein